MSNQFAALESASNPRAKTLAALGKSNKRHAAGDDFLLEGWTLVQEALRSGVDVREVFVLDEEAPKHRLLALLRQHPNPSRPKLFAVSPGILKKAATTKQPQPVVAIGKVPARKWTPPPADEPALFCGLWNPSDPGNLGAAIRVAEAAGAKALLAFGECVDPWCPKALRASTGSTLRLPVVQFAEDDLAKLRDDHGFSIFALAARTGRSVWEAGLAPRRPALMLFGNETRGLPKGVMEAAHELLEIPFAGPTESLNLAASAAVALFEAARQRRSKSA
jgi:TrmH family RNA methyltransferase